MNSHMTLGVIAGKGVGLHLDSEVGGKIGAPLVMPATRGGGGDRGSISYACHRHRPWDC